MSYAWLLGLVAGIVIATATYWLRRNQFQGETDERSEAIQTQARSTAFTTRTTKRRSSH